MRAIKFHQNFKLDRGRLATLMRYAAENEAITKKGAAVYMGVGEPAAEGCIGWFVKTGMGIGAEKGFTLTPLGSLVAAHDPELGQPTTLWLLHYHLAIEHNERSEVWHRAFNEFLSPGISFTRDALQTYVERSLANSPTNKSGVSDDCKEFTKCYTESVALGKLDLVREVKKNMYEADLTTLPESHMFAYALFDAWQRRFPYTDTLRVSQLCEEPELPGKLFVARHDQVVQMLQILQSLGMVNVVDSQHEPVTRRYNDEPIQLLVPFYMVL